MRTCVVIAFVIVCAANIFAQTPAQTRAQAIAAGFNKQKHVVKEKYGVRTEKYKDVQSEAVVRQNVRDYAGVYELTDLGYVINIQVANDGRLEMNALENNQPVRFEKVRIEGALLTASRIYQDGSTEKFEGVFLNRTERNSPSDAGVTTFGLGVVPATPVTAHGLTFDKLFYQAKH
ncbi:MAG TPA: hypothetical protein VF075_01475 [Pyrinomonadaceae bacterium]